ncbi:MAG TPA: condensation domain-containing protein, partial [Pyrinomonadaceae bacterium]
NFFELGGHSLLAGQVAARVRERLGVEVPLRSLFERPTARLLAELIEAKLSKGAGGDAPAGRIGRVVGGPERPLSFAQQRLWFMENLETGTAAYNVPSAFRLSGGLDLSVLERTLNEVIRRHEVLRTSFATSADGQPVQVIHAPRPVSLPLLDLSGLSPEMREAEVRLLASDEAQEPFDLTQAPLLRARLLKLSAEEHVALFTMHHIVCDGWSMGVLVREVAALYEAYSKGEPSPLGELPMQYADYAAWQRSWLTGEVLERQLDYWTGQLTGGEAGGELPVLELPADRPRPAAQSYKGAVHGFELSDELTAGLKRLSRSEGVTLYMLMLAAFQTLLHRYSGQEQVLVGTPSAGRSREELEGLIGFFVNTLVMRGDLSGGPSFKELLGRVREAALGAYAHQDVPFELLVDKLQPERDLSHTPLFRVWFFLQETPAALELPGLRLSPLNAERGRVQFDLTLSLVKAGDQLRGALEYNTDLFDEATVVRMGEHFKSILAAVVADPGRRVSGLPLLSEAERRQLLVEWNDTRAEMPAQGCVHRLFEQAAELYPEEAALEFEGRQLTYAELNARANRLARHLRRLGAGPESLVGILLERSAETVVAILGVLKAGAAYVPLDPEYPQDRLSFILEDARVSVLLTQESVRGRLPEYEGPTVGLGTEWDERIALESAEDLEGGAAPEGLAYVIYTSGSTGRPKGVAVGHRGLCNLAAAQASEFGI